jgi:hypothetical protein
MKTVNREVVAEIYRSLETLGAKFDLLGIVGSWGDSLPESQVLRLLRAWNNSTLECQQAGSQCRGANPHSVPS